jgi:hypothetical protein
MIFFPKVRGVAGMAMAVLALAMTACAPVDDSIGSHLAQPPAGTPPQKATEAGDIAIVGQDVSRSIMELPVIANATVPPVVQFTGVTSIVDKPIDTEPYTELLRDRLLLLTREKLRFVEHTLPPYVPPTKKGKKKAAAAPPAENTEADYQILAELRGHAEADFYKIQVEFVDTRSNEVLFNGLYRIQPEASLDSSPGMSGDSSPPPPSPPPAAPPTSTPDTGAPPMAPTSPTL